VLEVGGTGRGDGSSWGGGADLSTTLLLGYSIFDIDCSISEVTRFYIVCCAEGCAVLDAVLCCVRSVIGCGANSESSRQQPTTNDRWGCRADGGLRLGLWLQLNCQRHFAV